MLSLIIMLCLIVAITVLVVGWVALYSIVVIARCVVRLVAGPFRAAKRADAAVLTRFDERRSVRVRRGDDVQCCNRRCCARLPADAKFCARCGEQIASPSPHAIAVIPRSVSDKGPRTPAREIFAT